MKRIVSSIALLFFLAKVGFGQTSYNIPVDIEISEDAINLFLLKQHGELGGATSASYTYQGVEFTAELLPPRIDLKANAATTYLELTTEVSWENSSVLVTFSYYISFNITGTDDLSVAIIIGNVRSSIQNTSLPDPVKTFILDEFDDLNLQAYPDKIVEKLNQDQVIEEHPVEFTSFQDSFSISENALNITVTFGLQAEEPEIELMLTSSNQLKCRINFKAEFKEMIITYLNGSFYTEVPFSNYGTENTYFPSSVSQMETCVVHFVNAKNAYKAYFSLTSIPTGVWIQPDKLY